MNQNSGFKILGANPVLARIAADMKEKTERVSREKRERLEKLRAANAQPTLDLAAKLSARVHRRLVNA